MFVARFLARSNPLTRICGRGVAPAFFMSTFNGLYNPRHAKSVIRKRKDFTVNDTTPHATSDIDKSSENFMRGEVSVFVFVPSATESSLKIIVRFLHCRCRSWTTQLTSELNPARAKRLQAHMKSPSPKRCMISGKLHFTHKTEYTPQHLSHVPSAFRIELCHLAWCCE